MAEWAWWPVLTKDIRATMKEILESEDYEDADVNEVIEALWQAMFRHLAGRDSFVVQWRWEGLSAFYGPFWTKTSAAMLAKKIGARPGQLGLGTIRAPRSVQTPQELSRLRREKPS